MAWKTGRVNKIKLWRFGRFWGNWNMSCSLQYWCTILPKRYTFGWALRGWNLCFHSEQLQWLRTEDLTCTKLCKTLIQTGCRLCAQHARDLSRTANGSIPSTLKVSRLDFRLESESHKSSQHWLTTWLTGQVQVLSQPFHLKPSSTPHAVQAFARIKTAPMLTPRTSFEQPDARHRVVRPESQNARNWMIGMDVWLVGNLKLW